MIGLPHQGLHVADDDGDDDDDDGDHDGDGDLSPTPGLATGWRVRLLL